MSNRSLSRLETETLPVQMEDSETMQEIDLVALLYRLAEKWKILLAAALIGAILSGLYTVFLVTPKYQARSKLYVMNNDGSAISVADLQIGTYLTQDYQEVFKNWHVHEKVIEELGLPYSYSQLSGMLNVTSPSNTRILYITVTSESPQEAKAIADTYASVAREFIAARMDKKEPSIFEEALLPSRPSSPNRTRNILLGFVLGLVVAAAVIIVQFIADDKIRTADDITRYVGLPTLGLMPKQEHDIDSSRGGKKSLQKRSGKRGKK